MSIVTDYGRFGNHFFRYLAISFIAEKHNLFIIYSNQNSVNIIENLGITLFNGKNNFKDIITLIEYDLVLKGESINNNYYSILNADILNTNIDPNNDTCYCQTKYVSNLIYNYLRQDENKYSIINMNQFQNRYYNNNDCFIHVRLTDAEHLNPGFDYYNKVLSQISYDNIYLASDDINHDIIKNLLEKYPKIKIVNYDIVDLIKFASTNKHVILSHGSFSAIIGFFSFYSNVYYPEYEHSWHGDMFSIPEWNIISK